VFDLKLPLLSLLCWIHCIVVGVSRPTQRGAGSCSFGGISHRTASSKCKIIAEHLECLNKYGVHHVAFFCFANDMTDFKAVTSLEFKAATCRRTSLYLSQMNLDRILTFSMYIA